MKNFIDPGYDYFSNRDNDSLLEVFDEPFKIAFMLKSISKPFSSNIFDSLLMLCINSNSYTLLAYSFSYFYFKKNLTSFVKVYKAAKTLPSLRTPS